MTCPNKEEMGEYACENQDQCWEPCGRLGKDEKYAVVVRAEMAKLAQYFKEGTKNYLSEVTK